MLAVVSTHLPVALRTFLLTLAVVDDLFAITIIAVFYTRDLQVTPLLLALVPLTLFTVLVQRRVSTWWLLVPLALTVWALVHASGVHATVAGCCWGSPSRCCAATRQSDRGSPAQLFPSGSSTGFARSRPEWPSPSSPFSRQVWPWAG